MSAAVPAAAPRTTLSELLREYDRAQDELVLAAVGYVVSGGDAIARGNGEGGRHATARLRWNAAREASRRSHAALSDRLEALDRVAERSTVR